MLLPVNPNCLLKSASTSESNALSWQPELFPTAVVRTFHGANGTELPYWEEDGNVIRVALSDTLVVDVTKQKGGHIYANVPDFGRIERKNKTSFLAAAAQLRRSLDINVTLQRELSSMQRALKEQQGLLSSASQIRPVSSTIFTKETEARVITPDAPVGFKSRVLIVDPELELKLGRVPALILRQLNYLLRRPNCGKVLADGRKYVFHTYEDWRVRYFRSLSISTIKRGFIELEKSRLIHSEQPEGRRSRRKYYTLTSEGIKMILSVQDAGSEWPIGRGQNQSQTESKRSVPCTENENTKASSNNKSAEEIVEKYQKLFPEHNVREEFKRYQKQRQQFHRPLTEETFADWMARAQLVITPLKPKISLAPNKGRRSQKTDDFDPEAIARLEQERETRERGTSDENWNRAGEEAKKMVAELRKQLGK